MNIVQHECGNIREWSDGEAYIIQDLTIEKNVTLILKNCILRFVPDAGLFCLGKIIAENCTFIPVDTNQPQWRKIRGTTGWKGIADIGKGRSSFIGCTFIGGSGRPLAELKSHFISRYFGEIDDLEVIEDWTDDLLQEERDEAYAMTIGGALITLNSLVQGCTFQDCHVQQDGGAMVAAFNVQIEECTFKNCQAGVDGGAVILKGYSTIKQCLFESCRAGDEGGAILCDDSVIIKECLFKICRARTGGGIATHRPSRVYNCHFIKCLSMLGGGGISGEIIGKQLVFRQCRSRSGGGAELEGGSILKSSIFYKCRAKEEGGGVCSFAISRVEIERCKFVKCNAGETGGGARIHHTTISRGLFKNNTITAAKLDEMSADHLYASGNSLIDRCTFENRINTSRTVPKYILFESRLMEQKLDKSVITGFGEWKLYLDDIRNPPDGSYAVARSVFEAQQLILQYGMPRFISFDHDLGADENGDIVPSGYDFAKWLVEMDLNGEIILTHEFDFAVHSMNPIGADNIRTYLRRYLEYKTKI